jgi:hypothetical protein
LLLQYVKYDLGRLVGIAARALRDAAERGVIERDDVDALAHEWLTLTGGDHALAVLEIDDEFIATRVIEFCERILDAAATDGRGAEQDETEQEP